MIELLSLGWREEKKEANEWRAKQLFALIPLLRHTRAPQGERSGLKLTFALHWEGQGDTAYIYVGCQKVFIVSRICLQLSLWRDGC